MGTFQARAKDVFLNAVRQPAAERRAYAESACAGDSALHAEVQSLLDAYQESEPHESESRPAPFAAGEVFASRYRMVALLGHGGMGDVWRADDLVLGIAVALKLMHSTTSAGETLLLNEVRLARRITHPAVCRVFDIGEENGQLFFTMELVQGEDLAALVHRVGRLPPEKVADLGRQLCEALAAAHAQGILHRDLKPANILIDEHGQVRITDFGIAVTRDQTGPHTGVGTPGYMAPEQLTSGGSVSERTDLYALGLVLYELLVGRRTPDVGGLSSELPRPSTIVPGIPPALERVIMDALSSDPQRRPASAAAMGLALSTPQGQRVFWRRVAFAAAALGIAAMVLLLWRPFGAATSRSTLTEQDTLLLGDFMNTTGDTVFDGALKVALAVALEQSPFMKIFPDQRVAQTLRLMNRPTDERITGAVAREIAQREQLKALVTGSIASLGRNYVIAIEAINAQNGDVMARQQVEVSRKEDVLTALGQEAASLREKLGESLASIQKFDVPLPRATTSSLEALHAYALALDRDRLVAREGALPHLMRAIDLDPQFALAYAVISGVYANTGHSARAPEYSRRAFELRDRVSERERFFISWRYYHDAVQDWDKALELARTWTATYPREAFAFNSLGAALNALGRYEQAVAALHTAAQLDPSFVAPIESLGSTFMALSRHDEVRDVVRRAEALRPGLLSLRRFAFLLAFVAGDSSAMARELDAVRRLPNAAASAEWEARVSAFGGRLADAHRLFQRAVEDATRGELHEVAGLRAVTDAEAHAAVGQCADARADAGTAMARSRDNFTLERAGRALALCGASTDVARISGELAERFPDATLTRQLQLPVMAAALAIQSGEARRALALLEPVKAYDRARGAEFWPGYLRGLAHLAAGQSAEAAREFEANLGHRGEAADSILYQLSHLGLARAAAAAGDVGRARTHYDAFFDAWQSADPDLQPLREARAEYRRLR